MARLDNTFERKLKAAGVHEPLCTILSTETPERTAALGSGVKQYTTLAAAQAAGATGLFTLANGDVYSFAGGVSTKYKKDGVISKLKQAVAIPHVFETTPSDENIVITKASLLNDVSLMTNAVTYPIVIADAAAYGGFKVNPLM